MEAIKARTFVRGMGIATAYCAFFLITWKFSVDQWYLPAGLRLASLLLLPMRYWPYVFVGDAAALLVMRVPKIDKYGELWAYASPFLYIPIYSILPYLFRRHWGAPKEIVQRLPALAAVSAIWSTLLGRAVNTLLQGPVPPFSVERFISFCVGDFLGILMVMLPCLLWQQRHQWHNSRRNIVQTLAIALLMVVALYGSATIPTGASSAIRLMPLVFMLLPLVYLTILHGWHGAAVGTLLINFSISMALPHLNEASSTDSVVLIAQSALAMVSGGLMAVGIRVSNLHERSGDSLRSEYLIMSLRQEQQDSEARTRGSLRAMLQSFERRFREKALLVAYARDDLDGYRHAVAQALKDEGLYQQAMEAMSSGVESARALVRHSELLYPLDIETHGLVGVLTSETFEDKWKGRARIEKLLTGRTPKRLSIPLQLAAYRAICSAMDVLATMEPTKFHILARGWERRGRKGITIFVSCTPTTALAQDSTIDLALQELQLLARAYDGAFQHRHPHRIGVLMSEPLPPT